ncbi:MAG: AraD1 family protein [Burkholderiales bacterium]
MRLVQFIDNKGTPGVARVDDDGSNLIVLAGVRSTYELATAAVRSGHSLESEARTRDSGNKVRYEEVVRQARLLPPLTHPDPYHCLITGTGLSHLGSAAARDSMHAKLQKQEAELTDSMKMFKWGVEGGKPTGGKIGTAPEWFYKGDGRCVVPPGGALELPPYALDGGEEVEIVGLYIIGNRGQVLRVGFALGNEYSDHVMERQNYLYLAHSKLRQCSYGPELLIGDLPKSVTGRARLLRGDQELWAEDWLSGEDNMCHSLANLEHHHFKYRDFRQPGDVHVHFFGAATGSFTKKVETRVGDIFEIHSAQFGQPLRNTLAPAREKAAAITVQAL